MHEIRKEIKGEKSTYYQVVLSCSYPVLNTAGTYIQAGKGRPWNCRESHKPLRRPTRDNRTTQPAVFGLHFFSCPLHPRKPPDPPLKPIDWAAPEISSQLHHLPLAASTRVATPPYPTRRPPPLPITTPLPTLALFLGRSPIKPPPKCLRCLLSTATAWPAATSLP